MSDTSFAKAHFELIARVVNSFSDSLKRGAALAFAYELAKTNENFDIEKFLAACGEKK